MIAEIDFIDDREGCLFTVTVHRKSKEGDANAEISPIGSPKNDAQILELIKQDASITTEQLGVILGMSKRTILKQIEKLKAQGRLLRVGPTRGGHWKVPT